MTSPKPNVTTTSPNTNSTKSSTSVSTSTASISYSKQPETSAKYSLVSTGYCTSSQGSGATKPKKNKWGMLSFSRKSSTLIYWIGHSWLLGNTKRIHRCITVSKSWSLSVFGRESSILIISITLKVCTRRCFVPPSPKIGKMRVVPSRSSFIISTRKS